eukprot:2127603-Alexandrium_andersonii.AAC.1
MLLRLHRSPVQKACVRARACVRACVRARVRASVAWLKADTLPVALLRLRHGCWGCAPRDTLAARLLTLE